MRCTRSRIEFECRIHISLHQFVYCANPVCIYPIVHLSPSVVAEALDHGNCSVRGNSYIVAIFAEFAIQGSGIFMSIQICCHAISLCKGTSPLSTSTRHPDDDNPGALPTYPSLDMQSVSFRCLLLCFSVTP